MRGIIAFILGDLMSIIILLFMISLCGGVVAMDAPRDKEAASASSSGDYSSSEDDSVPTPRPPAIAGRKHGKLEALRGGAVDLAPILREKDLLRRKAEVLKVELALLEQMQKQMKQALAMTHELLVLQEKLRQAKYKKEAVE
jgi:hypothetical protein